MWPLLAFVWAYQRTIRPIPRGILLSGAAAILLVVFPVVGSVRTTAGTNRLSWDFLVQTYASIDNPLVAILSEMGTSMQTVAHTLELVPSTRPFDWGIGYLYGLGTILPNLFGGVHPAIQRGTASEWLVRLVAPWEVEQGGGLGYSFIAEAYLNFSWVGGAVFLGIVGMGMSYLFVGAMRSPNRLLIASAAITLSFLTHYARGEFYTIARPLVWYVLIPCALVVVLVKMAPSHPAYHENPARP
jgi:oligosaccharide repeat unit polymerase